MSKVKLIVAGAVVAVVGVVGVAALQKEDPKPSTQQATQTEQHAHEHEHEGGVEYKGEEGKNALELLKAKHQVETKKFEGLGEMVTSINGVEADSKHFWAFYVNGKESQVGAGSYETKDSDRLKWELKEIEQ